METDEPSTKAAISEAGNIQAQAGSHDQTSRFQHLRHTFEIKSNQDTNRQEYANEIYRDRPWDLDNAG